MSLSSPKTIFGIHSVTPYAINNSGSVNKGQMYGTMKVLQSSSLAISGDLITLQGGANAWPWQVENGYLTNEISLSFNEYPDFVYELFLGKKPTTTTGETTGDVSAITNSYGTSVASATTGIASVTATAADESDLKFTKYAIVAVTPTTIDVYAGSDIDFARGTDSVFENDALKITASPLTVTDSGGTVTVDDFGLTITGGSGTVAFTAGDIATFEVRPINTSNRIVTIGGSTDSFVEFGLLIYGEKQGSGSLFEIDCFRCKALGAPINFNAKEFSNAEVTAQSFYDSTRNGVFSMREMTI